MTIDFDWRLVRSFLAALDRGSLLGAARALGSSQPTIGRHIEELESQLGCVLFERTGRGLAPTAMALQLADAARGMESSAHALARAASGADATAAGSVRISASQPVATHLLPPLLAQMRQALPAIRVELVSTNAVSNLLRREADIAIRMARPDQASLIVKRIGQVGIGAYADRDYLRRRGMPRRPSDLTKHDLIGTDQGEDLITRGFSAMGIALQPENFSFRSDDLNAYWQAVRAGLGIGFVANYLARGDERVLPVLPELKLPTFPVWLVVHREVRDNRRIRSVYDFLSHGLAAAL